jgi:acyl carrier protein
VSDRAEVSAALRDLLLNHRPQASANGDLDDASLGEDGLGLDSIEIVEVARFVANVQAYAAEAAQ